MVSDANHREDRETFPRDAGASQRSARVLFCCLGNICRSPTVEGVVHAIAAREFPELSLQLDSAGTADYHLGEPPDSRSIAAAMLRGYDISGLRARQVMAEDFSRFDLILAMDRANLDALRRMAPIAVRERVKLFLEYAPQSGLLEVPDPYYEDTAVFEQVLDLSEAGARGLLLAIRGARDTVLRN